MADEVRVEVARNSFGYRGETYLEGDEFDVPQSVADNHPNTLDVIESSSDEDVDAESSSDEVTESDYDGEDGADEICGAEMSDGDICERPADSCPYHD